MELTVDCLLLWWCYDGSWWQSVNHLDKIFEFIPDYCPIQIQNSLRSQTLGMNCIIRNDNKKTISQLIWKLMEEVSSFFTYFWKHPKFWQSSFQLKGQNQTPSWIHLHPFILRPWSLNVVCHTSVSHDMRRFHCWGVWYEQISSMWFCYSYHTAAGTIFHITLGTILCPFRHQPSIFTHYLTF